jgi:hypothetical protein
MQQLILVTDTTIWQVTKPDWLWWHYALQYLFSGTLYNHCHFYNVLLNLNHKFYRFHYIKAKTRFPKLSRGCIFCHVRLFYEWSVSEQDRSMHRSLWALVAYSSFIEGSHMTKNTDSELPPEKISNWTQLQNQTVFVWHVNRP